MSGTISDNLPCKLVCNYQRVNFQEALESSNREESRSGEFTKAKFHTPEPWNGNLDTAEVLFVSSNPSIDFSENFPTFSGPEWTDEDIVEFFINRLDVDDEGNSKFDNQYWKSVLKCAGYILGKTDSVRKLDISTKKEVASRIALTEIVHCKSEGEIGVDKAAETCFRTHTQSVIQYFLQSSTRPKTIVFVGGKARNLIYNLARADAPLIEHDQIADYCATEFKRWNKNARILFIPHPNARQWKSWKTGKPCHVSDPGRQQIIDQELNR